MKQMKIIMFLPSVSMQIPHYKTNYKLNVMNYKYFTLLASFLFLTFTSCSKNNENLETESTQNINSKAFIASYGPMSLSNDLNIEIPIPETHGFIKSSKNFFVFYKEIEGGWQYLTNINLEKNYRLGYTMDYRQEDVLINMRLIVEDNTTFESYSSTIEVDSVQVIGIKLEELRKITPGDVNYFDYHQLTKYLGLKN